MGPPTPTFSAGTQSQGHHDECLRYVDEFYRVCVAPAIRNCILASEHPSNAARYEYSRRNQQFDR